MILAGVEYAHYAKIILALFYSVHNNILSARHSMLGRRKKYSDIFLFCK